MTVREIATLIDGTVLTGDTGLDREVRLGYCCDLLSFVMAHGSEGMAWITVQTHMNVIAVATLHDMSCVIIPESGTVEAEVVDKAMEEGMAVLTSPHTSFGICGMLSARGIPEKG